MCNLSRPKKHAAKKWCFSIFVNMLRQLGVYFGNLSELDTCLVCIQCHVHVSLKYGRVVNQLLCRKIVLHVHTFKLGSETFLVYCKKFFARLKKHLCFTNRETYHFNTGQQYCLLNQHIRLPVDQAVVSSYYSILISIKNNALKIL